LAIIAFVEDIYEYSNFDKFDFILIDSMFHFGKKAKAKESNLLEMIFEQAKPDTFITICIQNMQTKIAILTSIISKNINIEIIDNKEFEYKFEDKESGHSSLTNYKMISVKKVI